MKTKKNNSKKQPLVQATDLTKQLKNVIKPLVKNALVAAGGASGAIAGGYLGAPNTGRAAGRILGAKISKLIGSGDYELSDIKYNSLFKKGGDMPMTTGNDPHSVRIRHREFICDVNWGISNYFVPKSFEVNPGLASTFPWLSQIARLYEFYRFYGLAFEFVSDTSAYSASPGMGTVIMSGEYNMYHPTYASKVEMENSAYAISARPDKSMVYGIECSNCMQNQYLVRSSTGAMPLTTSDFVRFVLAISSSLASGTNLGELWVVYDIELSRPFISSVANPILGSNSYAHVAIPNIATSLTAGTLISSVTNYISSYNYSITLPGTITSTNTLSFNVENVSLFDIVAITVYSRQLVTGAQTPYTFGPTPGNCVFLSTFCNNTSGGTQYQQATDARMPNAATGTSCNAFGLTVYAQARWSGGTSIGVLLLSMTSVNGTGVNNNIDIIVTKVNNPGYEVNVF